MSYLCSVVYVTVMMCREGTVIHARRFFVFLFFVQVEQIQALLVFPFVTKNICDMDKNLRKRLRGIESKCDAILRELRLFGFRPGVRLLDSVRASARALRDMSRKERERMERERGRGLRR